MGKRGGKPTSLWDILVGSGKNSGYRYKSSGGSTYTSGPAKDKRAKGGKYVSVQRPDGGKKSITYDRNGNQVRNKGNSKW